MTNKRKLIYVWAYLDWGGAQIYFISIMKRAIKDWNVTVILPKDSKPDIIQFLKDVGVEIEFIDTALDNSAAPTVFSKLRRQYLRIKSERIILKTLEKYDLKNSVLHIETGPWQSVKLLKELSRRQANIFVTLHNFLTGGSRRREKIWKRKLRDVSGLKGLHIFTSNQDTKDKFKGWFTDEFHETIKVTYTSVDPVQIAEAVKAEKDEIREKYGLPKGRFVILTVGQFIDRKGRWVLLEAAKKVKETHPECLFIWVMPALPTEEETVKIKEYGVDDMFMPFLSSKIGRSRNDVLSFFRAADAFTLPSFIEGLPISLLEAMALEIPSISTNVFAIPEAVKDRETGLLIEAGDSERLASAIIELTTDNALRKKLAASGSEFVLANFNEEKVAEIAIKEYSSCFADGK